MNPRPNATRSLQEPDGAAARGREHGNFRRIVGALTLTGIGDKLAGAKTTLPWLLAATGAPAWCAGLLVPVREAGSMLPQMALGPWVKQQIPRKRAWIAGSILQALALLAIGWVGVTLRGVTAGLAMLALLAVFSLGRAASSLASKDVIGRAITKGRRGHLNGWAAAISGVAAMAAGAALGMIGGTDSTTVFAGLVAAAAMLWFLASAVFARVVEPVDDQPPDSPHSLAQSLAKWRLLRDDLPFRRFVAARALATGSALAAPYYLLLARHDMGSGAAALGIFIAAEGLAAAASSPLWGRWADHSSRASFATACVLAGGLSLLVAGWSWLASAPAPGWFYPMVFFGLGVAHAGVRVSRKTHLIDMAEGDRRTDYVAVSNSAMGVLLLTGGGIGAIASLASPAAALVIFALAGFAAAWLAACGWAPSRPH